MIKKLLSVILTLVSVSAMAGVPLVTKFYPNSADVVQEYRSGNKIWVYFNTGSKVVSAQGELRQDGALIGTVTFKGSATATTTASMNPADAENEAIKTLQAGDFSLTVTSVTYIEDGDTLAHEYAEGENPLGTTTYHYFGTNGSVLTEKELDDNTMLSYYPADGEKGLMIYTFSKPVLRDGIVAELEYGGGDTPTNTRLPWTLSDDGLTLTVDFRGKGYDSATLSHGRTFYDMDGNPIDPPTNIVLIVSNLNCPDGTKIAYEATSLEGTSRTTVVGKIHKNMYYHDLTLPTPVLKSAVFFSSLNPEETHTSILPGCDMMALTVTDAAVLAQTDMKLTCGNAVAGIEWKDIKVEGEVFTVTLPEAILVEEAGTLVISLENYTFTQEDGVEHVIKPLDLSKQLREVLTVAGIKALETGATVALNVPGGVKVTLSNDYGYCFLEDDTEGLMIVTADYSKALQESVLLKGKLAGTYQGYGTFMIDPLKSDYTETPIATVLGLIYEEMEGVLEAQNNFRLLTFIASEKMPISVEGENIIIGGSLPVLTVFADGFEMPATVTDVTGILYNDPGLGQAAVIIRSSQDVNQGLEPTRVGVVRSGVADGEWYNLQGVRVKATKGVYLHGGKKVVVK